LSGGPELLQRESSARAGQRRLLSMPSVSRYIPVYEIRMIV